MAPLTNLKDDAAPVPAKELFDEDFFRLASECSVEAWLAFLGHRWNALILYHLQQGPKRFGGILECLPKMTSKVLTERLVQLERWGLIFRPDGARGEPYQLTPKGQELMPILHGLEVWSRDFPKVELTR
jgi:DNA-binding HxlR family transcriptional regulator